MKINVVKTHKVKPGESLQAILDRYITLLKNNCILAIASKLISTCENRFISNNLLKNKKLLIKSESEYCFPSQKYQKNIYLTLKNHRLIPNAGIDESNSKDKNFILLPKRPQQTSKIIWKYLKKKHCIKNFGVILTDSNVTPLRTGVIGIGIGWCGFKAVYDYIGKKDIFGRNFRITKINLLDSLATVATLVMGEGSEQCPISIIDSLPRTIIFQNRAPKKHEERETYINHEKDLFGYLIKKSIRKNYSKY